MARIRIRPIPWPDRFDEANYKDFRRGAMEDAFWDEDELVDYVSRKKKDKPKKKKGCPENDFGPHVYVWVTEIIFYSKYTIYGFVSDKTRPPYTVDRKTCCGCNKIANSKHHW